jgi:thiamine biosynthesis lipoprotein
MAEQTRRRFFQMAIGAGGLAALSYAWMRRSGSVALADPGHSIDGPVTAGLQSVTRTSYALGTDISMLALHRDRDVARQAINDAFAELETVEQVMSIYRSDSQLTRLNREGVIENPHPYLVDIMRRSQEWSQRSNGDFDVTVQPLWDLFMAAKKTNTLPSDAEIDAARAKVGWKNIEVDSKRIRFTKSGMSATFNGIAQGYAGDKTAAAIRKHGVEHALLNTGEITGVGKKADNTPWTCGIQHPRKPDAYINLAKLEGKCLATSGDYATYFSPDFVYNHIFDPATGRSPLFFSSVTIIADNCTDADALTKPLFVGGIERGMKLVEETKSEAFIVFKDGKTMATKGFPLA